ncbi:stage III sporulation protein AG [Terrilactibacillus laevilacticus]|uniref:stage III sporulation protein AG n=1 Tax=Terrilactibacillus laevilacticus TaxID=1380157 RepID=UPI0011463426|nr:stage III sporulation protein AG [Terrilactibacillus laevilacticus]
MTLIKWIKDQLFKNQTDGSQKKRLNKQTLLLLGILGISFMLISHFFTSSSGTDRQDSLPTVTQPKSLSTNQLQSEKEKLGTSKFSSISQYESYYNQHLAHILEQITGVSKVSVMVTFSSTEKNIYQDNVKTQTNQTEEQDRNGGTRTVNEKNEDSEVVVIDNNNQKAPVIVGKEQPEVRGVLVVADGANNPTLKSWIMQAVSTVLDVPNYKIQVLPKR